VSLPSDLPSERANPASERIDAVSTEEMLAVINGEDARVAQAVASEIPSIARALDGIEERYRQGGRLFYLGAGTSGRLGVLDASEIPPTYGEDPGRVVGLIAGGAPALVRSAEGLEDLEQAGADDLQQHDFSAQDALVGIAASGRTPYVIGGLKYARSLGAVTVALTTHPEAAMLAFADYPIAPEVGPEVIAGSTRMKSGTAQKLVLNMLSTGLMIRMGRVLGNRMVNVRPSNEKLRERARRLIMEIAECDREQAARALDASDDVRLAVVMVRFNCELDEAQSRLEKAEGVLRRALEDR